MFARLLLCLLLAAAVLTGQAAELYAVCGAYPPEEEALRKVFGVDATRGWTRSRIKGVEFWRGAHRGRDLLLFRTGISLVNAAHRLQVALDHFPVTHVLFAGVAGGTDPSLQVGDIVIPEHWAYHSENAYLNEDGRGGYVRPEGLVLSQRENFGMMHPRATTALARDDSSPRRMEHFPADAALLAAARRAAEHLPAMTHGGRTIRVLVGGTGVSGPVFLDNAAYREWVFRVWQARCVDMESTALAQVCHANGLPVLIVRGLSDLAGGQQGKNPINDHELPVAEMAARVLRAVVEAP